jgi:hypothetical protein
LETDTDAETPELAFAFQQEPMRIGQRDFGETSVIAGTKLCRNAEINSDHVCYFRISANGLAISQK